MGLDEYDKKIIVDICDGIDNSIVCDERIMLWPDL